MQVKSILNRIQLHKGFVYGQVNWCDHAGQMSLEIKIRARKGRRPVCSGCGKPGAGYDTQSQRRFGSASGVPAGRS